MEADCKVKCIEKFNRFFTLHIGALHLRVPDDDVSLPEARVLFEIAANQPVKAADLCEIIQMDRSNLSRIINKFEKVYCWVSRDSLMQDGRVRQISLTPTGQTAFVTHSQRQRALIVAELCKLTHLEQLDLVQSLTLSRILLSQHSNRPEWAPPIIREFTTGDIALIASRQAKINQGPLMNDNASELIALEIATQFLKSYKLGQDQCYVAEIDGCFAGGVLMTQESPTSGRISLFHVENYALERGIGDALLEKCKDFAHTNKWTHLYLWVHNHPNSLVRTFVTNGFQVLGELSSEHFGLKAPIEIRRLVL